MDTCYLQDSVKKKTLLANIVKRRKHGEHTEESFMEYLVV